ncbi:PREDICTED: interleukin-12 receptor subunit beta-1 [Crocodylus porosus]|uniref:interleukin-12 receptor subunit beta-1 n=1 Tax=Crocodylus porosus TaxID=8502 RepID=UPI00093D948C|nr:PREDICTED: interleukin-12 receptor subunit beta-1 [Crocodylus porosus]
MLWRLLLWLAVLPLRGSADHPDLLCYRSCNRCDLQCAWRATVPSGNATYRFQYCYHGTKTSCTAVGARTTHYTLPFRKLYLLKNFTAWVESGSGDRPWRTRNVTLQLENAIKLDPPHNKISFSRANGTLRLQLPRAEERAGKAVVLQREVRHRQGKDTTWTLVECETQADDKKSEDEAVTCDLGQTAALELQIRHKMLHWSSTWSDWSQIILVPAEIVERPRASYTLGRLGQSGQRNLTLQWQKASEEQGNVTYTVAVRMLTCGCGEPMDEISLQKDVAELNLALSGAEHSISLSAANAAGYGPAWTRHIPPDSDTEIRFLAVSTAGTNTTVQWAAKANGTFYCLEKQPLGDARRPAACIQKPFVETGTYTETGVLEPRRWYRIAVHGQGPGHSWATFAATYHFTGTDREANALATRFTLQGLQPGTVHRAGIQAGAAGTSRPQPPSRTQELGNGPGAFPARARLGGADAGFHPHVSAIQDVGQTHAGMRATPSPRFSHEPGVNCTPAEPRTLPWAPSAFPWGGRRLLGCAGRSGSGTSLAAR